MDCTDISFDVMHDTPIHRQLDDFFGARVLATVCDLFHDRSPSLKNRFRSHQLANNC